MSLDERITSLERGMSSVMIDLAVVRSNYATKEDVDAVKLNLAAVQSNYATKADVDAVKLDLAATREDFQKAINTLTWKMYGVGTLLVAVVFFIAKNVD